MKTSGKAYFTYTNNPDTKFDPCWKVTLKMTDNEAAKLRKVGIKPKRDDDGVFEYTFKRLVTKRGGFGENKPPRVVDANKNPMEGTIIGNDSVVNVQWAPFSWEYKGKKGVSADFQAIQVVELVPYTGGSDKDEFDSVGESPAQTNTAEPVNEF